MENFPLTLSENNQIIEIADSTITKDINNNPNFKVYKFENLIISHPKLNLLKLMPLQIKLINLSAAY
jgi:hypothetical protein